MMLKKKENYVTPKVVDIHMQDTITCLGHVLRTVPPHGGAEAQC